MQVQIVIKVENGNLTVASNVHDQVMMLGLMEMAKASVLRSGPDSRIEQPPPDVAKKLLAPPG